MIKILASFFFLYILFYSIYPNLNLKTMYKNAKSSIYINMREGLGNRLMSYAGIIALSILYKSKPYSIKYLYIASIKLERV